MSSRNLLNLVLLAIVAVLVLLVVYEPGQSDKQKTPLTALKKDSVKRIAITRTGQADITLVKENDTWQMTTPYTIRANQTKAESLLGILEQPSVSQFALEGKDKKAFGLDKPRASIVYNDEIKIQFGGNDPINKQRYVQTGDDIHLVSDNAYYQLMIPVTMFVDHKLLPQGMRIEQLSLPNLSLRLQDGTWSITPVMDNVSNDRANALIEHWQNTHAMHVSEYADQTGHKQVRIHLAGQEQPLVFDIINQDDRFFLGRRDLNLKYELAPDHRKDLLTLPPELDNSIPGETPPDAAPAEADK